MMKLLAPVAAFVSLGILAFSGTAHAMRPRRLRDVVARQTGREEKTARRVVSTVIVAELSISILGGGAIALGFRSETILRLGLLSGTCLYGMYAAYLSHLLRRRPGVPCGCSGTRYPVNRWAVFRAAVLMTASLAAMFAIDDVYEVTLSPARLVIAGLAGTCFGVILWNIPASLHDPDQIPALDSAVEAGADDL